MIKVLVITISILHIYIQYLSPLYLSPLYHQSPFRFTRISNLSHFDSLAFRISRISNLSHFESLAFRISRISNLSHFESLAFRISFSRTSNHVLSHFESRSLALPLSRPRPPHRPRPRLNYSDIVCHNLCSIYNSSINMPTLKQNGKACLNNYRPTSLLPVVSKLIERKIYEEILTYIEKHFSPYIFGYRKGRNTEQCLISMMET